jgi:transposase-like protein
MRHSGVDELGPAALEALAAGASVAEAASAAGVAEQTLRTWIWRGRRDPEGRFGRFADAVPPRRVKLAALPRAEPGAPLPTRDELLRRLDEQSRKGSTRATELLLRSLPPTFTAEQNANVARILALAPPAPEDE